MIAVEVKLFATLQKYHPRGERGSFAVELPEGATLADLYGQLGIPMEELKMAFVDNRRRKPDFVLADGQEVAVFPPIAGGWE